MMTIAVGIILYLIVGCIITKIFVKHILKDDFETLRQNIEVGLLFTVTVIPLIIITYVTIIGLIYKAGEKIFKKTSSITDGETLGYTLAKEAIANGKDPYELYMEAEHKGKDDAFDKGWKRACRESGAGFI